MPPTLDQGDPQTPTRDPSVPSPQTPTRDPRSWKTSSYVLFASPFFVTLAPVRHLDPTSFTTIQAQTCVRCKTEPTIELSAGLEKQSVHHPDMEISDAGLGNKKIARDSQVWCNPSRLGGARLTTKRSRAGALFNPAGSINSKPKTRFRSVFCCLVKTSGSASERANFPSSPSKEHTLVGLQEIGLRRRFQSWNMSNVDV